MSSVASPTSTLLAGGPDTSAKQAAAGRSWQPGRLLLNRFEIRRKSLASIGR